MYHVHRILLLGSRSIGKTRLTESLIGSPMRASSQFVGPTTLLDNKICEILELPANENVPAAIFQDTDVIVLSIDCRIEDYQAAVEEFQRKLPLSHITPHIIVAFTFVDTIQDEADRQTTTAKIHSLKEAYPGFTHIVIDPSNPRESLVNCIIPQLNVRPMLPAPSAPPYNYEEQIATATRESQTAAGDFPFFSSSVPEAPEVAAAETEVIKVVGTPKSFELSLSDPEGTKTGGIILLGAHAALAVASGTALLLGATAFSIAPFFLAIGLTLGIITAIFFTALVVDCITTSFSNYLNNDNRTAPPVVCA